jgi:hypothetical protein
MNITTQLTTKLKLPDEIINLINRFLRLIHPCAKLLKAKSMRRFDCLLDRRKFFEIRDDYIKIWDYCYNNPYELSLDYSNVAGRQDDYDEEERGECLYLYKRKVLKIQKILPCVSVNPSNFMSNKKTRKFILNNHPYVRRLNYRYWDSQRMTIDVFMSLIFE